MRFVALCAALLLAACSGAAGSTEARAAALQFRLLADDIMTATGAPPDTADCAAARLAAEASMDQMPQLMFLMVSVDDRVTEAEASALQDAAGLHFGALQVAANLCEDDLYIGAAAEQAQTMLEFADDIARSE